MSAPRSRVLVAVLTFRRPALVAQMLPGVVAQAAGSPHEVAVLVVDNDPARSAEPVVTAAARAAALEGVTVEYAAEPTPGIVAGRNRALDHASAAGADALAFVDDDEQVEPGWLDALVTEWRRRGAAAVAGPTIWPADLDLPPWVAASGYYRRPRRPTGTVMPSFASGNVLLDLAVLRRHGLRFDPRFGTSGGEDTVLARSLVAAGGLVTWCDEAVTVEDVPPDRRTRAFVLRRDRRRATTWVQAILLLTPRARTRRRVELVVRALWRGGRGAIRWPLAVVRRDLPARAHAEREVASAGGMLAGLAGRRHEEYGRAHTAESG